MELNCITLQKNGAGKVYMLEEKKKGTGGGEVVLSFRVYFMSFKNVLF